MKWSPEKCLPGDMIRIRLGSFCHYGIYVSDEEVIQFGLPPVGGLPKNGDGIRVLSTDIDTFSCGKIEAVAFRTSVAYEDRSVQGRKVRGPAIIISNHTSVYDYAVWLFVFYSRTLRVPMAEILFEKQPLGIFLSMMGGIRIDRNSHSLSGLEKCSRILKKGGTVLMFPEGRLPREGGDGASGVQAGSRFARS